MPDSTEKVVAAIESTGRKVTDLKHIIVTHCHADHAGSVAALKRMSGARVYMHSIDAAMVRKGESTRPMTPAPGLLCGLNGGISEVPHHVRVVNHGGRFAADTKVTKHRFGKRAIRLNTAHERRGRSDSRRVLGGTQRRKAAFAARAACRDVILQADLKVRLYVSDVRTHHDQQKDSVFFVNARSASVVWAGEHRPKAGCRRA